MARGLIMFWLQERIVGTALGLLGVVPIGVVNADTVDEVEASDTAVGLW
jgi:hypothetical protein